MHLFRRLISSLILLSFIVLSSLSAEATIYYVSPTGLDTRTGLSLAQAWKTIQRAANTAVAGDLVYIADGDYDGGILFSGSGIAGSPIIFRAINPGSPRVHGEATANTDAILIQGSYIILDGLIVSKGNRAAICVDQANHVTVRRCKCIDNAKWGIFADFSDDLIIEYNECASSHAEHGINIANSGDRPIVRYNVCHDNALAGIQINGDASQLRSELAKRGDGIIENGLCMNNIVYNCGNDGSAAINLQSIRTTVIVGNLVYNNLSNGISLSDDGNGPNYGSKSNRILNNTVYFRPTEGQSSLSFKAGSTGNTVLNNIFYGGLSIPLKRSNDSSFTSDYNVLFSATGNSVFINADSLAVMDFSTWKSSTGNDLHSTFTDPLFKNDSAYPLDFHVIEQSSAVGLGMPQVDVLIDIDRNPVPAIGRINSGCFQSLGSAILPLAPTVPVAMPGNRIMTIVWGPSAGAAYYNVKRAKASAGPFTTIATCYDNQFVDTSLTNGTNYFYKVSAVNVVGESALSAVVSGKPTATPAYAFSVKIVPQQVAGSLPAVGTVFTSDPAPVGGLTFTLTSSNAVASTLPSVTIPEGKTSATFPITTKITAKPLTSTFTATRNAVKHTFPLVVTPPGINLVSTDNSQIIGGLPVVATFALSAPAPPKGVQIEIFVDSGLTSPISVVTIPAGAISTNVTFQSAVVTSPIDLSIVGHDNQNYAGTVVTALPLLSSLTLSSSTIIGGNPVVGTLTISSPAPVGGVTVNVVSSLAGTTVPATLTIPVGAVTADFNITTPGVAANSTSTITVSFGSTSLAATLTVKPAAMSSLTLNPTTVKGGVGSVGTVTLTGKAPPAGFVVTLSSNSTSATVPASVTVPAGSSTATFNITTKAVTANVNATITASGKSSVLKITP